MNTESECEFELRFILPVICDDKFIPQHLINAIFNFKFIFLQRIQIAVFMQCPFEVEYKAR